jgi:hypothetical protein
MPPTHQLGGQPFPVNVSSIGPPLAYPGREPIQTVPELERSRTAGSGQSAYCTARGCCHEHHRPGQAGLTRIEVSRRSGAPTALLSDPPIGEAAGDLRAADALVNWQRGVGQGQAMISNGVLCLTGPELTAEEWAEQYRQCL